MCSKKISLQKSGNTDIIQNTDGCSMLQSDGKTDIIQNNVSCSMLRCDWGVMAVEHGGGNLVSTWIGSLSVDNMLLVLGDFFFLFHEFSMNKYKCKLLCTIA